MFFKAAEQGNNRWYIYIATIILFLIGYTIGNFPFVFYARSQGLSILELADSKNLFAKLEDKNMTLLIMLQMFTIALLFFLFSAKVLHKRTLKSFVTGFSKFRWKDYWFAFVTVMVFMIVVTVVSYYSEPDEFILQFEPKKFLGLLVIAFVFLTIQTCTEELFFRGFLTQGIGKLFNSRFLALLLPSLIFGAMHLANPEAVEHGVWNVFPLYILMGVSFGIMTLMHDGAEVAMGYHAANNIAISLLVTSPEAVLQTNSILKTNEVQDLNEQYIALFVSQAIILAIFAWKYKWKNWGGKLLGPLDLDRNE